VANFIIELLENYKKCVLARFICISLAFINGKCYNRLYLKKF